MFRPWIVPLFVIGGLGPLPAAADDGLYDVRGPAVRPGFAYHVTSNAVAKGVRFTFHSEGVLQSETTGDLDGKRELEITVEAAEDRRLTKIRTRVINEEQTFTTFRDEIENINLKVNPLVGRVVVSERRKAGWTHRLAEGDAGEAEAAELMHRPPPFDDSDLPKGKLKIGASWKIPPEVIARGYADETDLKATGELTSKFIEVRMHAGEPCAVIRTEGPIRGTFTRDGKEASFDLQYKETRYRSLRSHFGLKAESRCVLAIRTPVNVGTEVQYQTLAGTMKVTHVFKVVRRATGTMHDVPISK